MEVIDQCMELGRAWHQIIREKAPLVICSRAAYSRFWSMHLCAGSYVGFLKRLLFHTPLTFSYTDYRSEIEDFYGKNLERYTVDPLHQGGSTEIKEPGAF